MILQTRQTLPVLIQLFVTSAVETVSLNNLLVSFIFRLLLLPRKVCVHCSGDWVPEPLWSLVVKRKKCVSLLGIKHQPSSLWPIHIE